MKFSDFLKQLNLQKRKTHNTYLSLSSIVVLSGFGGEDRGLLLFPVIRRRRASAGSRLGFEESLWKTMYMDHKGCT